MTDEIDVNRIAAEIIALKLDDMVAKISRIGASAVRLLTNEQEKIVARYLAKENVRISKVKTILYRDQEELLEGFYVSMKVLANSVKYGELELLQALTRIRRVLITGTAGAGKSLFLKKLLLVANRTETSLLHVYLEARKSFADEQQSIERAIELALGLPAEPVRKMLEKGKIALLIDGVDEISNSMRREFDKALLGFAERYPDIRIVVTSRPDEKSPFWTGFVNAQIVPLSLEDACELVSSLKFDEPVKQSFVARIRKGLYGEQREFLQNPLLATVMLMTFQEFSELPERIHEFHSQAFETLFKRHDYVKETYQREHHTDLGQEEFRDLSGAFSLHTYLKDRIWFDDTSANEAARWAIRREGADCEAGAFLADLADTVCILGREGIGFSYLHRSMQEYLVAHSIRVSESAQRCQLIDYIALSRPSDNVLLYLRSMVQTQFEVDWALSFVERVLSTVGEGKGEGQGLRMIAAVVPFLTLRYSLRRNRQEKAEDISFDVTLSDEGFRIAALGQAYGRSLFNGEAMSRTIQGRLFEAASERGLLVSELLKEFLDEEHFRHSPQGEVATVPMMDLLMQFSSQARKGLERVGGQAVKELVSLKEEMHARLGRRRSGVDELLRDLGKPWADG